MDTLRVVDSLERDAMGARSLRLTLLALGLAVWLFGDAEARPFRPSQIPNGTIEAVTKPWDAESHPPEPEIPSAVEATSWAQFKKLVHDVLD